MHWSWRLAMAAVAFGLVTSSCSPQELAEIFAVRDLGASDNPVKAAAGDAADALNEDRSAQQLADEGLRERSIDKLVDAAEERPRDPRYPAYVAAHSLAEGNRRAYVAWLEGAADIIFTERDATIESLSLPEDSEERRRVRFEAEVHLYRSVIEGLDWALAIERGRTPMEPKRVERLESELCKLQDRYYERFGLASGGAPVLVLVGGADCPDSP